MIDIYFNNLNIDLFNAELALKSGSVKDASVFLNSAHTNLVLCKSFNNPDYNVMLHLLGIKLISLQVEWNIQHAWVMLSLYSTAINNNHMGYALAAFSVAVKQIRTLEGFYQKASLNGLQNETPYIHLPQQIRMLSQHFSKLVVAHNSQDLDFLPISTRLTKSFGNFFESQKELGIGLKKAPVEQISQEEAPRQRSGQFSPVIEPPSESQPAVQNFCI